MKKLKKQLYVKDLPKLLIVATSFWLGVPAVAQTVPAQNTVSSADNDTTRGELERFDQFLDDHHEVAEQLRKDPSLINNEEFVRNHPELQTYLQQHPGIREEIRENPNAFMHQEDRFERHEDDRDRDITRGELERFDQFLDDHHEVAEQLRKDPSLINNEEFVRNHPELQAYLQQHPGIREEIRENPNAFMHQEDRFDRNDITRGELERFDQFLDDHHEVAEQLRKDPSLINNEEFVRNHPELQAYLQQHPGIREEIRENPNAFMHQEDRFERHEDDRDRDITRGELERFDQFLDSHREIAEQLRKNPSLVNNEEFVKNHPALQAYLQEHPGIREEIRENPYAFMHQEDRFDRHEDRDRDRTHGQLASFGEFLGSHSNIAQQLSKDPSLVKSQEYMENHPELQAYLNTHADVRAELQENPQRFIKSAQQFSNNNGGRGGNNMMPDPKRNQ